MKFRLFLIISVYFLFTSKSCNQKSSIQILEATSQSWVGGMEQTGSGINYTVKIFCPDYKNKNIRFDSLWVNNTVLPVRIFSNEVSGDTVTLRATEKIIPPKTFKSKDGENIQKDISSPASIPPLKTSGEGIIKYVLGGKNDFLVIEKFHKLQSKNYP